MFYLTILNVFTPSKQEDYFPIFFYGVIFYIAFFFMITNEFFESNYFTNLIKDNFFYLMLLDFSYLFYKYTGHRRITKVKIINNEKKNDSIIETESITFTDTDSDNDVKISQQSDKSTSINLTDSTSI